jgi:subtilisin-like proprotein convertase family protein
MKFLSFFQVFGQRWRNQRARRRQQRKTAASRFTRPLLEGLEDRTLMAVLPAPLVGDPQRFTLGINPVVSIDPVNPLKIVSFYTSNDFSDTTRNYVIGQYSTDGGATWTQFPKQNRLNDPNTGKPFARATDPSVAFDRSDNFYLVYSEHDDTNSSGNLLLQKYDFTGSTPTLDQAIKDKVLTTWLGGDQVFNPVVAVDTNQAIFTDPTTGQSQFDPYGGKAVYVVWSTNNVAPTNAVSFNPYVIKAIASPDGGATFTNEVFVNDGTGDPNYGAEHDAHPQIVFSQGTADGRVPGGQLNIMWNDFGTLSKLAPNQIRPLVIDRSLPSLIPPVIYQIDGTKGMAVGTIGDAASGGTGNPDVPAETTFSQKVNITDPNFATLDSLDVTVALTHPDLQEISVVLISPGGQSVTLLANGVDASNNSTGQGVGAGANLGMVGSTIVGTVFDQLAARSITDNQNGAPYIGHFRPEEGGLNSGGLNIFDGLSAADLNGTWKLVITDYRNDSSAPVQSVNEWSLKFTSGFSNLTFGKDEVVDVPTVNPADGSQVIGAPLNGAAPGSNYSFKANASTVGIGPYAVIASDNTLGSFSPYQGRIYIAYTGVANTFDGQFKDNSDVYLIASDDAGQTWHALGADPIRVNDDSVVDGFSGGNRPQFMPSLAVDQTTGGVVVTYLDARYDAARARVANMVTASIDGGLTFDSSQFTNVPKTAVDTLTNQTVVIEPIPGNMGLTGSQGFGGEQGLAVYAGHILSVICTNLNSSDQNSAQTSSDIYATPVTIAAGPRIISGDQGSVTGAGSTGGYNVSFAPDGSRQLDGIEVTFDRPIDPGTFTAANVQINYHDPNTSASTPGIDLSNQVTSVEAINPDGPLDISIGDAIVREVDGFAVFTVYLSHAAPLDMAVQYTTSDGTAVAGVDYTTTSGTLLFAKGSSTGTITVPILDNAAVLGNLVFNLTLSNASLGNLIKNAGQGIIVDTENVPAATIGDFTVQEGGADALVPVYLSADPGANTVTIHYSTSDGTAVSGKDYTGVSGTLTFQAGQTVQYIDVPVLNDELNDGNENFSINLSNPVNAVLAKPLSTVTIVESNGIGISIGNTSVQEGGMATFTAYLNAASNQTITVHYATADGTATSLENDYTSTSGTLTFAPGVTTQTFTVATTNNGAIEGNENFLVNLSSPAGASILQGQGVGTIMDVNTLPEIGVSDTIVAQPLTGTTTATFTITLSFQSQSTVTVDYTTADGTATTADGDYNKKSGTLTFAPGQTTKTVNVVVNSDTNVEGNENFFLNLSKPSNGMIVKSQGNAIIVNGNAAPVLNFPSVFTVSESAGNAVIPVYLSTPLNQTITVDYSTANGTATANNGEDYTTTKGTLTFAPYQVVATISVPIVSDTLGEPNENFFVNFKNPVGATLAQTQTTVNILDDDVRVTVGNAMVRKSSTSQVTVNVPFYLDSPSATDVTVTYSTSPDTAVDGTDYIGVSNATLIIPAGQLSANAAITIPSNSTFEGNVDFFVTASKTKPGSIVGSTGKVTLVDPNTAGPTLSLSDANVLEGKSETFTLFLSKPTNKDISVNYSTIDGTAVAGTDYTGVTNGTVTIPAGQSGVTFTIPTLTNNANTNNTKFTVQISNPTNGAAIARSTGTGLIVDSKGDQPSAFINDIVAQDATSGTASYSFTVSLSAPSVTNVSVDYTTVDGTAIAGTDYTKASGTLTIAKGQSSGTITVSVNGTAVVEPNKFFTLQLSNPIGVSLFNSTAVATILNDGDNISIGDSSALNPGGTNTASSTFTVYLDRPNANTITVNYATADNTAIAGTDYTQIKTTTLTFNPGVTSQTFTVTVKGTTATGNNLDYFVNLSGASGANIVRSQGDGLIVEPDTGTRQLSVSNADVIEGDAGTHDLVFTVYTSTVDASNDITFDYSTGAMGDTATADKDYVNIVKGSGTIAKGTSSTTVTVKVNGDYALEGNETLSLVISNPVDAGGTTVNLQRDTGIGTIVDDDRAPSVSIGDAAVIEGGKATFTLLLSAPTNVDTTITYSTADGTALAGTDYTAATNKTVVIKAGDTSATIQIDTQDDQKNSGPETFYLNLVSADNANIARTQAVGTILSSSSSLGVSIGDTSVQEGDVAGQYQATFTVYLHGPSKNTVTVDYATADGTATIANGDYNAASGTITFAPGETQKTFTVTVNGNTINQANRTFFVNLSNPTNASIDTGYATGTATIIDDDNVPVATVGDTSVEGVATGSTTTASFPVFLSFNSFKTVTVDYATADGTAMQPGDYTQVTTTTLTFNPGVTMQDVNVTVNGNSNPIGNRSFTVSLSNPSNATLDGNAGTGLIVNEANLPNVSIGDSIIKRSAGGTSTMDFTVLLSQPAASDVTFNYSTVDGTALAANNDYVPVVNGLATISAGQTSTTISIVIPGNSVPGPDVHFFVDLSNVANAVLARTEATGTIINTAGTFGATEYLIHLNPQKKTGTYSYSVGPNVQDRIRTLNTVPSGSSSSVEFTSFTPTSTVGANSTLTVSFPFNNFAPGTTIGNVTFGATISGYQTVGDLKLTLVAPDGTSVVLFNQRPDGSGTGSSINGGLGPITFDDSAAQTLAGGAAPFNGTFRPEGALKQFLGLQADGTWQLLIQSLNAAPTNTGKLIDITLTITPGAAGVQSGNAMDQNANGVTGEAVDSTSNPGYQGDVFAAPAPVNGAPLRLPFITGTLPLIIPGPHIVQTFVAHNPATSDNLVLNGTTREIDVVFDRDMNPQSFTADDVLRLFGPTGSINDIFFVAPDPNPGFSRLINGVMTTAADPDPMHPRTFKITFFKPASKQFPNGGPPDDLAISGTYTVQLGSNIQSAAGESVDNNLNAGVDVLFGTNNSNNGVTQQVSYNSTTPVTLNPGLSQSTITIPDSYVVAGATVTLDITYPNDPDLQVSLVAPDLTSVRLFTYVGSNGKLKANFSNTTFDDAAGTPIQLGSAPFNVGPYNPQTPLSDLKGHGSKGVWTLSIFNRAKSVSGTHQLNSWSLTLAEPVSGSGLGEVAADQYDAHFRIFTEKPLASVDQTTWTAVGPASINNGANSGRVNGLAVDPSDPTGNTVYVGGASGGVWKTSNFLTTDPNGPTYVPLTDLGPTNSLNIRSILVIPRNNNTNQSIILASTGESGAGTPGIGFLYSLDGGGTWTILDSLTNTDSTQVGKGNITPLNSPLRDHNFVGSTAIKVVADPNPTLINGVAQYILYAAVSGAKGGVYRSLDTGLHWTLLQAGKATDVVLAAGSAGSDGNLQIVYAAFQGDGVYRSNNQGASFVKLDGTGQTQGHPFIRNGDVTPSTPIPVDLPNNFPSGNKGTIYLATPTLTGDPLKDFIYQGWLYALVAQSNNHIDGLYLTKDFGNNWTQVLLPVLQTSTNGVNANYPTNDTTQPNVDPLLSNQSFDMGDYDAAFAIDPNNANIVYIGGTERGQIAPQGGFIRVDVTKVSDPYNLTAWTNQAPDGGLKQALTNGSVVLYDNTKVYGLRDANGNPPTASTPYLNFLRDPNNPFLRDSILNLTNVQTFNNLGTGATWTPFNDILGGTSDVHRILTMVDPLTGKTRLIVGDDQGVFTGVDDNGTLRSTGIGFNANISGPRNGNLQITEFYQGASQPSLLAAEIADAMFYGAAQDNGVPVSGKVLTTGDLNWTGPLGDAQSVVTDQTGSGTVYDYQWPSNNALNDPNKFLQLVLPGSNPVSRVNGLLQVGDNPANNLGQWPFEGGSNVVVNPINKSTAIVSSSVGRVFRTTDIINGLQWFSIAEPSDLDSSYAGALAFGAPDVSSNANLDNFIYAGTTNGNIFVTFKGGGAGNWVKTTGLSNAGPIQTIVADTTRGTHDAYAVAQNGVYYLADATASSPKWVNITGNLFSIKYNAFGQAALAGLELKSLTSLAVDWRYHILDSGSNPNKTTHPILYVGGNAGVYRSKDKGITWTLFPDVSHDGSVIDGGLLPNASITHLDIADGNITPATGQPDQTQGPNILVATTFGRGMFAIRLPADLIPGPRILSVVSSNPGVSPMTAATVTFQGSVDPFTFTVDKIVSFTDPDGVAITPLTVTDITPPPQGNNPNLHNVYQITFAGQTRAGAYKIVIGPNITDAGGNRMDQNGNGINGESTDAFTGYFFISTGGTKPADYTGAKGPFDQGIFGRNLQTGTTFALISNGKNSFTTTGWSTFFTGNNWVDTLTGDFNGDGKADIAARDATTGIWYVGISNGSSFTVSQWGQWAVGTWLDVQVGNFDGSGKDSIVGRFASTGDVFVARSTGSSFVTSFWNHWANLPWADVKAGDFNGDGKTDLVARLVANGTVFVALSDGGSFTQHYWQTWSTHVTWVDVKIADLDGNGKADIFSRAVELGTVWVSYNYDPNHDYNAHPIGQKYWQTWSTKVTWADVSVGDFDGDGKMDIVSRVKENGAVFVSLAFDPTRDYAANPYNQVNWAVWPTFNWTNVIVGDFTGDGRDDIASRNLTDGKWYVSVSTGTSFLQSYWNVIWGPNFSWVDVQKGNHL